jgi:outer membrane cobalamin receptor
MMRGRRRLSPGRRIIVTGSAIPVVVLAVVVLAAFLAVPTEASAEADGAAAGPRLEEVVVRAPSLEDELPGELARNGTRVDTVSAEQIQNGGYLDVADSAGALVPGLTISPKNGPFDYATISLQGARTQDLLWLVDGVRINNRLYGGTAPLDTFPAAIVERLEILDGPQALFFGTQGLAGAVNIVTRAFADGPGGALALGADSSGGRHLDAFVRDRLGRRHRVVLYGSADQSAGYQPFRDSDYQPSATDRRRAYEVLTLGGKYAYDLGDALRLRAHVQHTDGTLDFARPYQVARAYNQRDEDIISLQADSAPHPAVELTGRAYAHWWRSHYTELDNVVGNGGVMPSTIHVVDDADSWGYRDAGASALGRVQLGARLDAFVGYDFQRYSGNDAVLVISEKSESVHAVFAELAARVPGLRQTCAAVGLRYNLPSFGPNAAVWSASARSELGAGWFVRGLLGTAFRLPTAEELFANDPNDERGTPSLRPERSLSVDASVGRRSALFGVEVIGFARRVSDLIAATGFDATTNQSIFENTPDTVRTLGGTLVLDAHPIEAVSARASYTFASATTGQGGVRTQIDGVPRQQAKAWLDVHPVTVPLGLTLTVNTVGPTFRTFGADDRERLDGRTVVDLAGRVFFDAARRHAVYLRVANALDARYPTALGKGVRDADGSSYTIWSLGMPRTFEARYRYGF